MKDGVFAPVDRAARAGADAGAQLLWIALFAVATALAARVEIPAWPVPFTLQTLVVLLAGAFLGARNGAASQLLYLAVGVAGMPVFSSGGVGLEKLVGPTGGYLAAFPIAAAVAGLLVTGARSTVRIALGMAAASLTILLLGTMHLYSFYVRDLAGALQAGLLVFSFWDALKIAAAVMIYREFGKRWPKLPA
jgi:biotin transport system substrate-specific component